MNRIFDTICSAPLTPNRIVSDKLYKDKRFFIPIYQRLFVWEEKEINQLINDLWDAYSKKEEYLLEKHPYYIGIITIVKRQKKIWEIIDGQQRLTFLSLLGAYMGGDNWKSFLEIKVNKQDQNAFEPRIKYSGRPDDQKDLDRLLCGNCEVNNPNFRVFFECMEKFKKMVDSLLKKQPNTLNWNNFCEYVFYETSFLVAELPDNYNPKDLNLFFERMNSSGKQLTPVEQIKGKYFASKASDFDRCLILDKDTLRNDGCHNAKNILAILNDSTINIEPEPPEHKKEITSRLILAPETLLLHSLVIVYCIQNKINDLNKAAIPHSKQKVLEAFYGFFDRNLANYEIMKESFLDALKNYRQWIDNNIIYLDNCAGDYFEYKFHKDDNKPDDTHPDEMKQFQSMLYVSSSDWQGWVLDAYWTCTNQKEDFSLELLKKLDVKRRIYPNYKDLTYPTIDRYWFWLLDYILWEEVHKLVKSDPCNKKTITLSDIELNSNEIEAVIRYQFRRNRSIEHLQPQTDGLPDTNQWNSEATIDGLSKIESPKHWFGNLALITAEFNSKQSNESIRVKFANLKDRLDNHNLESIKMLLMFLIAGGNENGWTPKESVKHGKAMYEFLKSYFDSNSDTKVQN